LDDRVEGVHADGVGDENAAPDGRAGALEGDFELLGSH